MRRFAVVILSLLCARALSAQAFTTSVDPVRGRIIVTLTPCTTACPDSTVIVGTVGLTAFVRHVLLPSQRSDTLVMPPGASMTAARVVVTTISGDTRTTTVAQLPSTTASPEPGAATGMVRSPPSAATAGPFTPNMPPGLSLIVDTHWTPGVDNGLSIANWEFPCRVIKDPSAPFGADVLEMPYPGNDLGNGVGGCGILGADGQKWTHVYFALSMWFPPNYSMHSNGEKWLYLLTTAASDPSLQATIMEFVLNGDERPDGATFGLELMPNLGLSSSKAYPSTWGGAPYGWIFEPRNAPRLLKGQWQTVEVELVMNSPGRADGRYRAWINGVPVMNGSDALFRGGVTQGYFNGIKFDGTRGGGASKLATPPTGQVRRYGRLVWAARN